MVLDHVANCAGLIIERATALHAEILRHCDLHATHEFAVPERLQESVCETEEDHVVNGSFSKIVVDAKDVIFVESGEQDLVEVSRGGEIMAEWLLHNDTRAVGAVGIVE